MKRFDPVTTLLAGAFVAAACTSPVLMDVPKKLSPAADELPTLVTHAKGVQIYECRAKAGSGEIDWVFVAPEADLYDARGQAIGRHGAGPTWEVAGSTVKATVKERVEAPVAGAIPWLLLAATAQTEGRLGKVTSIQRVNTAGGVAPVAGCDRTHLGAPARVAYTADYVFFAR
jgi:hypothetical protein